MTTTIFTTTLIDTVNSDGNVNVRNVHVLSSVAIGLVRVTFKASSAGNMDPNHVGIAIATGTNADFSGSITELRFGGVSGFSIAANGTITSDWASFTTTAGQNLVTSLSMGAIGSHADSSADANSTPYVYGVNTNWNVATGTPTFTGSQASFGVSLIETISSIDPSSIVCMVMH
jgi:hypothetical protein